MYVNLAAFARDLVDRLSCRHRAVKAWYKGDLPKRYHFFKTARVEDVLLEADPGWTLASKTDPCELGAHGYDPMWESMNVRELHERTQS
jgi:hypothetical protein